ncbi:MAG: hypothetical protein II811_05640 [Spirochaetaceae bacterium]|nr:hypothetical protein [Spirochaetaceae bacterium]
MKLKSLLALSAVALFAACGLSAQGTKGAAFKGGKDFTGKSGEDVKKYVEGLIK